MIGPPCRSSGGRAIEAGSRSTVLLPRRSLSLSRMRPRTRGGGSPDSLRKRTMREGDFGGESRRFYRSSLDGIARGGNQDRPELVVSGKGQREREVERTSRRRPRRQCDSGSCQCRCRGGAGPCSPSRLCGPLSANSGWGRTREENLKERKRRDQAWNMEQLKQWQMWEDEKYQAERRE